MINRYFVKQMCIFMVYDRLTGKLVGHTLEQEVSKHVLKPQGLAFDDKIDPAEVTVGLGGEQNWHDAFKQAWYDLVFKKLQEKPVIKS